MRPAIDPRHLRGPGGPRLRSVDPNRRPGTRSAAAARKAPKPKAKPKIFRTLVVCVIALTLCLFGFEAWNQWFSRITQIAPSIAVPAAAKGPAKAPGAKPHGGNMVG